MNQLLDAAVQFIQVGLLFILVVQNFGLRRRLRAIEAKLARLIGSPTSTTPP